MKNLCRIRKDIRDNESSVPIGEFMVSGDGLFRYKWIDNETFLIFFAGAWREAYSIDFEFNV